MNENCDVKSNPWLHRFAVLTAVATFLLLGAGGLVTSHEAGMSVPDWPNSYGYNMFAFPPSKWIGGIFYEHTHRLWASAVGMMTTILAVWLWLKDSRRWMKWIGLAAFLGVVAQGVLGGLRVTLKMDDLGILHGVVGQTFFVLMCAIVLFTSGVWQKVSGRKLSVPRGLRTLVLATTVLIFCQLILGATMRGQHAGLAIPDFPAAYGQIWPDTSAAAVARYNADSANPNIITPFQIILQMVHRLVALTIFICVATCAVKAWRQLGVRDPLAKFALFWLALIMVQIGLGAWTIWSNKAADIATAHVLGGALSLVTGALWCIIAFGRSV
ncbi:MAG TPA: COX15/CtaA family protein, partial [Candidatus Baltobacteraceae bacterium]|nr:COX15/CtaA family protein [Candidatus Baltobacteraceae bacterium]